MKRTDPCRVKIRSFARTLASTLLDVLAPPRCAACEAFDPEPSGYCTECGAPEPLLDVACHILGVPVFAGARYAEPVASAIQRFKYRAAPELCTSARRALAAWCRSARNRSEPRVGAGATSPATPSRARLQPGGFAGARTFSRGTRACRYTPAIAFASYRTTGEAHAREPSRERRHSICRARRRSTRAALRARRARRRRRHHGSNTRRVYQRTPRCR